MNRSSNIFYLLSIDQKGKMLAANTLKDESEIALSEPIVTHLNDPVNTTTYTWNAGA